jgi:hypothetical protein
MIAFAVLALLLTVVPTPGAEGMAPAAWQVEAVHRALLGATALMIGGFANVLSALAATIGEVFRTLLARGSRRSWPKGRPSRHPSGPPSAPAPTVGSAGDAATRAMSSRPALKSGSGSSRGTPLPPAAATSGVAASRAHDVQRVDQRGQPLDLGLVQLGGGRLEMPPGELDAGQVGGQRGRRACAAAISEASVGALRVAQGRGEAPSVRLAHRRNAGRCTCHCRGIGATRWWGRRCRRDRAPGLIGVTWQRGAARGHAPRGPATPRR